MMRLVSIGLILLLTACGPLNSGSPLRDAVGTIASAVRGETGQDQPVITDALINADEILFVTIRNFGTVIPMTKDSVVGPRETWISDGGSTVTLENGILVATRGLGIDLSGADPVGTYDAILSEGGTSKRTHGYITTLDQTQLSEMDCEIISIGDETVEMPRGSATLKKFEEDCAGTRLVFKNEYWVNADGKIVRSLQVTSPQLGFLLLEKA